MKIYASQTDESSLAALGTEAVLLLCSGDIPALADRFGYALAFGRDTAAAIREDLALCLAELQATSLALSANYPAATVKYFEPNDTGLFAVVECLAPADNGAEVLVELVVTSNGAAKHVSLEQISAAA